MKTIWRHARIGKRLYIYGEVAPSTLSAQVLPWLNENDRASKISKARVNIKPDFGRDTCKTRLY